MRKRFNSNCFNSGANAIAFPEAQECKSPYDLFDSSMPKSYSKPLKKVPLTIWKILKIRSSTQFNQDFKTSRLR